jgi:DnaJ family protein C protein 19
MTKQSNSLILAGLTVAGGSILAKYGNDAYTAYKAEQKENADAAAADAPAGDAEESSDEPSAAGEEVKKKKKAAPAESSNPFSKFFNMFGKNYYEGGFEEKMTKREAALILGVRESASPDRIKECHRRILLNNHPDRGGSVYMATKCNEAKDLLMKAQNAK